MISMNVTIPRDTLKGVREAGRAAPGKMPIYIRKVVQPRLDVEVSRRLGRDPGPVKYKFEFATPKSRRFYFAMMRGRLPYRRTGKIRRGWMVKIDLREADGLIRAFNREPAAVYVYGPGVLITNRRQVPGHRNTGWGKGFERELIYLSKLARGLLAQGWFLAVRGRL